MFFIKLTTIVILSALFFVTQLQAEEDFDESYVEWEESVYLDVPYEFNALSFSVDNQWASQMSDCTLLPGGAILPYPFFVYSDVIALRYVPSRAPTVPLDECDSNQLVFLRTTDFIELLSLMTAYHMPVACYDPESCA